MAIADKDILITPNRSGILGNQPNVVFTGADSSIGDSAAITVTARPENSGTLSFTGTAGQLFSITNSLEGTIFAVNDVSGIPSLEIDDAGIIKMAEFNGRILLGGATDDSASLLQVNGHIQISDFDGTGSVGALKFGNDSSLKIYKLGSNNNAVIQNNHSTGDLLYLSHLHSFRNAGNTEVMANFIENGAVELNFNNNKSFATRNLGFIYEDSNVVADIGNQSNYGAIELGGSAGAFIDMKSPKTDDYDFRMQLTSGNTALIQSDDLHIQSKTGAEDYLDATVNGAVNLYYDNSLRFSTTSTGAKITGGAGDGTLIIEADTDNATEEDNALLQLTQDGGAVTVDFGFDANNNILIKGNSTSGNLYLQHGAEYFAIGRADGAFELYHDNSKKLETLDSGVNITGNLRVNNAEFSAGASAGFAIALAIAL